MFLRIWFNIQSLCTSLISRGVFNAPEMGDWSIDATLSSRVPGTLLPYTIKRGMRAPVTCITQRTIPGNGTKQQPTTKRLMYWYGLRFLCPYYPGRLLRALSDLYIAFILAIIYTCIQHQLMLVANYIRSWQPSVYKLSGHNIRNDVFIMHYDFVFDLFFTWCDFLQGPLLPRPRRGLRGIVFTRSVCLSVCLSVCPVNILVFYISAIRRDIDLKFIQDTYRVAINSLKKIAFHRSKVNHRTVHWFLKVQSYHKNWAIDNFQYFFVDTSLYALSTETIKTWANR